MIYAYRCRNPLCRTEIEKEFPIGKASPRVNCTECKHVATRDYSSIQYAEKDQFRKYWLSTKPEQEMQRQGRELDPLAPKDDFDRRRVEAATDRRYIGDDVSRLNPKAKRAVEKWKDKAKQREIRT